MADNLMEALLTTAPVKGKPGKRPIAEALKRKKIFGKVAPATREFLDQMPEPNDGRRVDRLVEEYRKKKRR